MTFDFDELSTNVSDANPGQIRKYIGIGLFVSAVLMFLCPLLIPFVVFGLTALAGYSATRKDEAEREQLRQQRAKREQAADIVRQRRKPVHVEDSAPKRLMKVRRK